MTVRRSRCETCPFRAKVSEAELLELAAVPPQEWPCHTEAGYSNDSEIQCRGHWGARRRVINRHGAEYLVRIQAEWRPRPWTVLEVENGSS